MTAVARSRSRSAARLGAVQALYQQEMEGTPVARLLREFHEHRLGATIEDETYHDAEQDFFDDIVTGVDARRGEIDGKIAGKLAGHENDKIVVHCRSGARSLQVTQMLRQAGFKDVKSMAGGILLWNKDVNPGGPQY